MKFSQFHKIISVLLIFIMLIQISGCLSSRTFTAKSLNYTLPNPIDYVYVIHANNLKYYLGGTVLSQDSLSGKIETKLPPGKTVQIFLSADSVMNINNYGILSVKLKDIDRVTIPTFSESSTKVLIKCLIVGGLVIFLIVGFAGVGPVYGVK